MRLWNRESHELQHTLNVEGASWGVHVDDDVIVAAGTAAEVNVFSRSTSLIRLWGACVCGWMGG